MSELSTLPRESVITAEEPDEHPSAVARAVTTLIVGIPFVAVALAVVSLWGRGVHLRDVVIAAITYVAIGHGLTIGYHRLLAHRSFVAARPLKLALVALGSMAFEGGPIGWVATHRRHHVFADVDGDPHSPRPQSAGPAGLLKGMWHAHTGWLFTDRGEPSDRRASDLHADRDLVVMDALFPLWCGLSLAIPFGLGWLIGGTAGAGLSALLWAGLVRAFLLQHVTWSVNSLGHMIGRRPFRTGDASTNIAALSLLSMGETWHNGHHAFPRSARHGLLPGQWDTSARVIQTFERLGWASDLNEPSTSAIRQRLARSSEASAG